MDEQSQASLPQAVGGRVKGKEFIYAPLSFLGEEWDKNGINEWGAHLLIPNN